MDYIDDSIVRYDFGITDFLPIIVLKDFSWPQLCDASINMHYHNCIEIGVCEKGSGYLDFIEGSESFVEGDISFIGTKVAHVVYPALNSDFVCSYYLIDVEKMLNNTIPIGQLDFSEDILEMSQTYHTHIKRGRNEEISSLLSMVARKVNEKKTNYQFSVKGLILDIMMEFFHEYEKVLSVERQRLIGRKQLKPAFDYIHANFASDVKIMELALRCNLSYSYFGKQFKEIVGSSPIEYITDYRLHKAITMLTRMDASITAVSENVGFQSISSFNRAFKKKYHMSPREWRKKD
ncbi:helix-turn-helix domain-containing protein [Butyrivibrio sp. NC3005]|uniref:helix-turn-helix domain-containing protein n=1 Tax=Butyrivibrio sp. NC3005 TaxID=1280685 RepID=UPI0004001CF9|nr:AraC family transcriptional regulator [Butyrivibrio sp. NC3005]